MPSEQIEKNIRFWSVMECSSCGKTHASVEFRRLVPRRIDKYGRLWEWSGKCPNTLERLLLREMDGVPDVNFPPDLSDRDAEIEKIRLRWLSKADCCGESICEQACDDIALLLEELDDLHEALRDEYGN